MSNIKIVRGKSRATLNDNGTYTLTSAPKYHFRSNMMFDMYINPEVIYRKGRRHNMLTLPKMLANVKGNKRRKEARDWTMQAFFYHANKWGIHDATHTLLNTGHKREDVYAAQIAFTDYNTAQGKAWWAGPMDVDGDHCPILGDLDTLW